MRNTFLRHYVKEKVVSNGTPPPQKKNSTAKQTNKQITGQNSFWFIVIYI